MKPCSTWKELKMEVGKTFCAQIICSSKGLFVLVEQRQERRAF